MIVPGNLIRELLKEKWTEVIVERDPPEAGVTTWVRSRPRALPAAQAYVVDSWAISQGGYAVVLELVEPDFQLPERPPEPRRFHLTRAQREQLFAGDSPRITGDGECPLKAGDEIRLSSRLVLRVLAIRPRKGGGWSLHYSLDRSDAVRLLRRKGGYTSDPNAAVDEAGEAPPAGWTDPGMLDAARERKARQREARERLSVGEELDSLLAEARSSHMDVRDRARKIEREIGLLRRDLDDRAA